MKRPTLEEQKQLVRQMEEAGKEVDRIRREALRGMPYNWRDVVALLELGDSYEGPPRFAEGMVEMQRLFMIEARRKGLTRPGG